uniref:Sugar phosphate transporter domain-containing protein n=1 Tax=Chromera velia CCMP2878 TaxID=1169474 RepID=A0A0G4FKI7_9ALVE|eukprot:Cvel_17491.t1-p1 / transcript=Cvel_17491.t1 / gene=Cvel_17491 / organism=Chromera_velia_CCMP2878 / gene_product=GDP-fucose transporter 1, putative / transcript_product=GDP-fucose transporter 1, putative / location=Cvel_scaffold1400:20550-22852(+) / protein_length=266 / sequence_SO=supercontig / SO=protein_coding / is_pseudo=false
MFVGMIASSNLCLKYVLMSTYQVARSLTLIFNVIVTYLLLGQTTSTKCLMACLVVCSGFVVGAMDSMTLSMTGVALGGLSSGFQAVYMVMIKKSLAFVDGDQNRLMTYNMSISSFLFLPIIVLADEIGAFYELPWNINDPAFFAIWPMLIFSAAMGVLIGIASYLCVKCTSPLTFNITGYAKACLQSLGGIIFLGDPVTYNSLGGILLTLFGSFWYSRIRMAESQQPQKQESQGGKRETGGKPEELQKLGGDADATKSSDLDESDR